MNSLGLKISKLGLILMFVLFQTFISKAQFREGAIGLNAGMAMPSGLTMSAGIPNNILGNLTFTYSFATSFAYVMSQNMQLEAGIGFVSASFSVPSGFNAPESQSLFSLFLGGKYFLSSKNDVMPYLGVGVSYTALPTIKSGTNETSATLLTVLGYFGAQGFLNTQKTVSLFIQFGIGYNQGTVTNKIGSNSSDNGLTNINFGGSAFGGSIYF
jgi:outer membrane protein W